MGKFCSTVGGIDSDYIGMTNVDEKKSRTLFIYFFNTNNNNFMVLG